MFKAIAIKYSFDDEAPKVVALGKGDVAQKIVTLAQENGVPIQENIELAEELVKLEVNQTIPPELYEAVAHVLALVYNLNNKIK